MRKKASARPALTEVAFKALTAAEQRVAIARDVLAQLEAERIVAQEKVWVDVPGIRRRLVTYDRRTMVGRYAPVCTVCGIGACFLAAVRLGNEFTRTTAFGLGPTDMERVVWRYFPPEQYAAIEFAFECGDGDTDSKDLRRYFKESVIESLREFWNIGDAAARLRAICESITFNGGDFPPPVSSPATECETT